MRLRWILQVLSSAKLALVLVLLVLLYSVAGAVIPQAGSVDVAELLRWQEQHPHVDALSEPLGLYHTFHSWGFLVLLFCLAINTAVCTVLHAVETRAVWWSQTGGVVRWFGFVLLHVSLIMLIAAGMWSAGTRQAGRIVLIEGQTFDERHGNYQRLAAGPLRRRGNDPFAVTLRAVTVEYAQRYYPVAVRTTLDIVSHGRPPLEGKLVVNQPITHGGVTFTQDRTGYAPRILLRNRRSGARPVDAFVALQAAQTEDGVSHRDVLPVPFSDGKIILTLYPDHARDEGTVIKTGEEPLNPILLVEGVGPTGVVRETLYVALGDQVQIMDHDLLFSDLRRWSAFGVARDAGYLLFCVALCVGIVALILRYIPELTAWSKEG